MIATDAPSLIAAANAYQLIRPRATLEQVIVWLLSQWAILTLILVTPVLTESGGHVLNWSSTFTPPFWNLYFFSGGNWNLAETELGTVTSFNAGILIGFPVYVIGVTSASGSAVTNPSNIITVT